MIIYNRKLIKKSTIDLHIKQNNIGEKENEVKTRICIARLNKSLIKIITYCFRNIAKRIQLYPSMAKS